MKVPVFKDKVQIQVIAGNGGNGSAAFRREKFIPRGGPAGGDGGNGGSVWLVGDKDQNSLLDLYFNPIHRAEHGGHGKGKDMYGRNGRDLEILIPCGTIVRNEETGEVVGEVIDDGQRMLVAKGGGRGLGNLHYKSSTNRAPTKFTEGKPGETFRLVLELKIISQIGLVGYPNAGKSTILGKLTHAHPKVAPYPFTTLNPVIGTIEYPDYRKLRVADIPGLIEGAHSGAGLGHDFLRHIDRTEFLVYVLDMGGVDNRTPLADYRSLREELKLYNPEMPKRPCLIVANKMDLPDAAKNYAAFVRATRKKPLKMVAELEEGVEGLKQALYDQFFGKKKKAVRPKSG
jgi:GTP-binding protein